jgi:glutathione-specific gamma-glutamylcyclotransferase
MWVFSYGSLMWQTPPEVRALKRTRATLHGYERSFCVYSRNYRGTPESPGLVLGLQPAAGSKCEGVAVCLGRPDCELAIVSLEAIDAQEMIAQDNPLPVYVRRLATLQMDDASAAQTTALAYSANAAPGANAPPGLSLADRAAIISRASGGRGPNREYLEQTASRLQSLGIRDAHVDELMACVSGVPLGG